MKAFVILLSFVTIIHTTDALIHREVRLKFVKFNNVRGTTDNHRCCNGRYPRSFNKCNPFGCVHDFKLCLGLVDKPGTVCQKRNYHWTGITNHMNASTNSFNRRVGDQPNDFRDILNATYFTGHPFYRIQLCVLNRDGVRNERVVIMSDVINLEKYRSDIDRYCEYKDVRMSANRYTAMNPGTKEPMYIFDFKICFKVWED